MGAGWTRFDSSFDLDTSKQINQWPWTARTKKMKRLSAEGISKEKSRATLGENNGQPNKIAIPLLSLYQKKERNGMRRGGVNRNSNYL